MDAVGAGQTEQRGDGEAMTRLEPVQVLPRPPGGPQVGRLQALRRAHLPAAGAERVEERLEFALGRSAGSRRGRWAEVRTSIGRGAGVRHGAGGTGIGHRQRPPWAGRFVTIFVDTKRRAGVGSRVECEGADVVAPGQ